MCAQRISLLFYNNRSKCSASSSFVQQQKRARSNDKKQHERENFHKQIKLSERDAQNFGIAFGAAWKAAN